MLTLSQTTIVDSSNLKELADNNFNFDENGRNFSKQVENTVGKGEIARYERFLLFPQCFQKTCTAYFRLSPLQKHVRKVVGGFGKESCVSTGVRKPGNTYASPTAVI